jgi:hypothetical protein
VVRRLRPSSVTPSQRGVSGVVRRRIDLRDAGPP